MCKDCDKDRMSVRFLVKHINCVHERWEISSLQGMLQRKDVLSGCFEKHIRCVQEHIPFGCNGCGEDTMSCGVLGNHLGL